MRLDQIDLELEHVLISVLAGAKMVCYGGSCADTTNRCAAGQSRSFSTSNGDEEDLLIANTRERACREAQALRSMEWSRGERNTPREGRARVVRPHAATAGPVFGLWPVGGPR